ncbi:hypothetical protein N9B31_00210 [Mariniblastus sp.]|nr:hypothetical protein [Mariniblastus sp.]MDB4483540.1 hypothetical protein [bacterium]MDC0293891.1 hypothetical protein [Mariniblastus sp.]
MNSSFLAASQRITADVFVSRSANGTNQQHLDAAVQWLTRAHEISLDGGVAYGYCLRGGGWKSSYVETSGYIVETFYDLAEYRSEPAFAQRAKTIAEWLMTVQNDDGSFSNDRFGVGQGIVFDTGQVLFGLVRAYRETGEPKLLESAMRSAQWLSDSMDQDGAWRRNTHLQKIHTYNTRSAWAMLELCAAHEAPEIESAARRNLDWALTQQSRGWFENCAFRPELPPFTHTIAYAIRGLLEGGRLLSEQRFTDAANESAQQLLKHVDSKGHIPGRIDTAGNPRSRSCCLTGNCQLAIIWYKLFQQNKNLEFESAASRAMDFVMSVQDVRTSNPDTHGAIKGSHPVWGKYTPLAYPNWATKFFIDAMLLREQNQKAPA